MFKGLRTVIYRVADIEKAKQWYSDVLGFKPYFDQPYYVGFNIGGFEFGLDPNTNGLSTGNNVIAYWGVDNIEKTFQHLIDHGATKDSDIQDVGEGIKVLTVVDPFGNLFGVIENPHFKPE